MDIKDNRETDTSPEKFIDANTALGSSLHWRNSSNVLCNYMKKQEYLDMVLANSAIIPRYVLETMDYLNVEGYRKICFPMTCFCDIPFSKVATHMSRYGEYGIGFGKNAVIEKYRIQPIHYISDKSPLIDDFRRAFKAAINTHFTGEAAELTSYLASSLMYMKPMWSYEEGKDGNQYPYVFQDECEWRYIPSDNFPKELHLILRQNEITVKGIEKYNEVLRNHPECWLKFDWEDVEYIIVPDKPSVQKTIESIKQLSIDNGMRDLLISKIEVSKRFADNM